MRRAQQGDKAAYAKFFTKLAPVLRGFISNRLVIKNDVDDVLQNILLSIHRSGHTYDPSRPIKLWVFAIAKYRLDDYLRDFYKRGGYKQVCIDEMVTDIPVADVTKSDDLDEYLEAALKALPEKQSRIVRMMKLEGHSVEETAKTMKMTASAVKVSAHRAYKALALNIEAARERMSEKEQSNG